MSTPPNEPGAGNAGMASGLTIGRHRPGVPMPVITCILLMIWSVLLTGADSSAGEK